MNAVNLRCEYMKNPCGIDVASPLLSWSLISDICGEEQSAYRIIVSNEEKTVWDSGKVKSKANSTKYNGISLQSNKHYRRKVCVWNKDGIQAEFSEIASFDTGIFNNEWIADWIQISTRKRYAFGRFFVFK